jgi:hypothetical protein
VQAYQDANRGTWSKQEWDEYIYAGMREQDAIGRQTVAVEKAVRKEMEAVALRLLKMGLPHDQVAEGSGLSLQDFEALAKR